MAELEDRGERTVICCQSVSAVCHCCFNQGRVSVGRLRLLFSRIRGKERPAAGLAWRYYTGAQLLKPLVHFLRFSQGPISLSDLVLEASALLSVAALRLCTFPSSSPTEPPAFPSSPPVNQTPWSGLHGGSTPAA